MAQLNLSQARVINPVLTQIAQGYQQLDLVGGSLFPTIQVGLRAGNIITFGREDFMLYGTQRAPGESTKRVSFGYSNGTFALVDFSLEGQLPIEVQQEAGAQQNGFSIDMASLTINKVQRIMALRLEKAQADLARTLGNYSASNRVTLSGASQFSDLANSDPISVIETAKEAVRASTGKRPNTMVMGPATLSKLRQHTKIIDRTKYTGRDVPTVELLQALFGVDRILVGEAIYSNDAGTAFTDVWGKDIVLAYTETAGLQSMGTPTYGYTYQLQGYPLAEQPYYDSNTKSWIFPVTRAEQPVIAGALAGYLIQNAVA